MNSKTAKLLNKASQVMAFNQFKETQEMPNRDLIYKNLKNQWNGMTDAEKCKSRKAMTELVDLAFQRKNENS